MNLMTGNRLAFAVGVSMLLALLLYAETVEAIWAIWDNENNPTYSHGPLLFLVSLYLLYQAWKKDKEHIDLQFSYVGLLGIIGASLTWFLAGLASVQIIQILALLFVLCFLFITVLGLHEARPYLFPVLLMIGALPVWEVFSLYLQVISAIAAGWLTSLTIQPSIREGMFIHIPAGSFEVEAGCSGLSYFIVSIIISLLFVYGYQMSIWRRLAFLFTAMLVAVVGNIIRVYIIILSGELTNMQSYFVKVEHVSLGWVIFFIGISMYLWQAQRFLPERARGLETNDKNNYVFSEQAAAQTNDEISNGCLAEENKSARLAFSNHISWHKWLPALIVLVAAVCIGPLANKVYQSDPIEEESLKVQLPEKVADWKRVAYEGSYRPVLQQGAAIEEAGYSSIGQKDNIYILVNYFERQHQGSEAVSDTNQIAVKDEWFAVGNAVIHEVIPGFSDLKEVRLQAKNGKEKLVWFWYEANGVRTSKDWLAKIYNILGVLQGESSVRVVVIAIDMTSNLSDAREQLSSFLGSIENKIKIINVPS